tara:strand:- start:976 stop:1371 length:396 start_codon:yes stop_codon:yes gene_type:complete
MNKKNFKKYIELSKALVTRNSRHVSFIVNKGKILSIGLNNPQKTHPKILKYNYINREKEDIRHDVGIHSELSSVIKLGTENLNKHQMINVRIDLNGEVTMSKPCNGCQDMINQLGINEVYYTDKNGIFKKL